MAKKWGAAGRAELSKMWRTGDKKVVFISVDRHGSGFLNKLKILMNKIFTNYDRQRQVLAGLADGL